MIRLGVNIDHVATLRQARGGSQPSVRDAALVAEKHGADGITVHLREDRRHIQDADVYDIREHISISLNLEMSVAEDIVDCALAVRPEQATLVPERREELTTEGGLDVRTNERRVKEVVAQLTARSIDVSLFIDPVMEQIDAARTVGAPIVEFHTGEYANADDPKQQTNEFERLREAAAYAHSLGLVVNAGHGLNYENVQRICRLPNLHELNIGHAIISRAVFDGLGKAVFDMKALLA